ncbi:MAG: 3-methyl-2-oxobutanoate dehydrogenase subunit VorB [Oscillospiraceae bacterium]|nr:3-methyl-2-oxobutanoate dehydrogenase subunit VorB [Oscillospiraceae bacterium]
MSNKTLMKGNEALAESAIRAGCKCYFGYPITPQNEIGEYMAKRIREGGGVFLQAESEISAINMVYGCAATGTRCMTSSSSPGISLKAEGISYIAGADLPCVIVNVQRGGPGLGTIQPSQADYFQTTRAMGHGDLCIPVLAPYSVQEMVDMTAYAFDLADEFRTPVMILADGVLGQMMEPVELTAPAAGPAPAKNWAVTGHAGTRGKNVVNSLYLQPEELEKTNVARFERYKIIERSEIRSQAFMLDDADVVAVAYGATARITRNAVMAARELGVKAGLLRPVTLWPFPKKPLAALAKQAKSFVVVEMSMGQMIEDVELAIRCAKPVLLLPHSGGIVHLPEEIAQKIQQANRL